MVTRVKDADLPTRADDLICFAIYSAGHALNRTYGPMLRELGLTYPQYIALTMLWDEDRVSVGQLGERMRLESNTLTPLLKRLQSLGHIIRERGSEDERQVFVSLTRSGRDLHKHALGITRCVVEGTGLDLKTLDRLVADISALRDNLSADPE